ncbi:MAG: penicillin-binding transpeptidase domain-containing protein, partial [Clostridia bacterium]
NTVSMKVVDELTPERSFNFMTTNLGFSKLQRPDDVNLAPLALGGLTRGVSVLEMAAAYSAFPNKGTYIEPHTYTKVLDNQGNILMEKKADVVDAMSEKTASYMNYMLQKVMSPGGTGELAMLKNDMPAGGKTGTTDSDKDRWFVGYTPYYAASVWFGYDKPRHIESGLSPALTIWKKVMNEIHKDLPKKDFYKDKDFEFVDVCSCSGLLPSDSCANDPRGSQIVRGYFHKSDIPTKRCDVHTWVRLDTTSMQRPTEFCPSGNISSFGLLDLSRFFPMSGITVLDEKYTIHNESAPDGQYSFYSSGSPMRNFCSIHKSAASNEPVKPPDPPAAGNPSDKPGTTPPTTDKPAEKPTPETPSKPPASDGSGDTPPVTEPP